MSRIALTNERWGFSSNCFVCEPSNDEGLRIPFFHDDDADTVVASFELDDGFSGAPSYVHGGISLSVLDEAQSWATIALAGKFAVTTETTTRFTRPVRVGSTYDVTAEITAVTDDTIATAARITFGPDRKVCAESSATFAVLSAAQAVDALGADVTGTGDAHFLGDA